ncbi:MAG: type II secretion system major pseudopilin GspG [Planctomycetes bacterium]|nr:type II secretion system major pseudopilin GspG [Planctomycetota bacterium]
MTRVRFGFAPGSVRARAAGFTLLEVMVVVVILGMLATVAVTFLTGQLGSAQVKGCKAKMHSLQTAMDLYKLDFRKYPDKLEDLLNPPADAKGGRHEPFVKDETDPMNDVWGNPFKYAKPGPNGKEYDIVSMGNDGSPGGDGANADISCWDR